MWQRVEKQTQPKLSSKKHKKVSGEDNLWSEVPTSRNVQTIKEWKEVFRALNRHASVKSSCTHVLLKNVSHDKKRSPRGCGHCSRHCSSANLKRKIVQFVVLKRNRKQEKQH